jgi:hypothetical protein
MKTAFSRELFSIREFLGKKGFREKEAYSLYLLIYYGTFLYNDKPFTIVGY